MFWYCHYSCVANSIFPYLSVCPEHSSIVYLYHWIILFYLEKINYQNFTFVQKNYLKKLTKNERVTISNPSTNFAIQRSLVKFFFYFLLWIWNPFHLNPTSDYLNEFINSTIDFKYLILRSSWIMLHVDGMLFGWISNSHLSFLVIFWIIQLNFFLKSNHAIWMHYYIEREILN